MKTNELRIEAIFELKELMDKFGYKITELHNGKSFVLDCRFYETEFENVIITDYDFINDVALNDLSFIAFNRKTGKSLRITAEFMKQSTESFKQILKELL